VFGGERFVSVHSGHHEAVRDLTGVERLGAAQVVVHLEGDGTEAGDVGFLKAAGECVSRRQTLAGDELRPRGIAVKRQFEGIERTQAHETTRQKDGRQQWLVEAA